MRQINITENDDPLKRIQEEINEVARRERELRDKMHSQKSQLDELETPDNGLSPSVSPQPPFNGHDDSSSAMASLTSSVNSKESLDEHNSDDSGISASSSPVNGTSANEKRYIRPNGYTTVPSPPPQKLLTRTVSTPQIFTPNRRLTFASGQKGMMQRFIASRGKLALNNNNNLPINGPPSPMEFGRAFGAPNTMTPPIIQRDADGKPIRRGYVPVEEKIQKELKDLKSRETELKKFRRMKSRQSTPDLLDCIDDTNLDSEDDDSDVEHCFGPGKLRSAKSISELCDSINLNHSLSSERTTPSPDFDRKSPPPSRGMRPALSLAQLCDLAPEEEAPSSHQLIAKWESLIQQNA